MLRAIYRTNMTLLRVGASVIPKMKIFSSASNTQYFLRRIKHNNMKVISRRRLQLSERCPYTPVAPSESGAHLSTHHLIPGPTPLLSKQLYLPVTSFTTQSRCTTSVSISLALRLSGARASAYSSRLNSSAGKSPTKHSTNQTHTRTQNRSRNGPEKRMHDLPSYNPG